MSWAHVSFEPWIAVITIDGSAGEICLLEISFETSFGINLPDFYSEQMISQKKCFFLLKIIFGKKKKCFWNGFFWITFCCFGHVKLDVQQIDLKRQIDQ